MIKITCDNANCGKDITYTRNSIDYSIRVSIRKMPCDPDIEAITVMGISRPLDKEHYDFCSKECLIKSIQNG